MARPKKSEKHFYTPYAIATLVVLGMIMSTGSYMLQQKKSTTTAFTAPSMSGVVSEASPLQNTFVASDLVHAYYLENTIYLVATSDILSTEQIPLTSSFNIRDNFTTNLVKNVSFTKNIIILEVAKPLTKKQVTVSYSPSGSTKIVTRDGEIGAIKNIIVSPLENLDTASRLACQQNMPTSDATLESPENTIKLKYAFTKLGLYNAEINSNSDALLADILTTYQKVHTEILSSQGHFPEHDGKLTQQTIALVTSMVCK